MSKAHMLSFICIFNFFSSMSYNFLSTGLLLPVFPCKTFIVSWLIFKSFIHLKFILVYGLSWWSSFNFFCMYLSRSPNTIYWRGYFYFILCPCLLCQILIDHRDMGLFLGSLFWALCSIDLCVCSYASTTLFWLQWPWNIVWYQVLWSLLPVLLSLVEDIWGCLLFRKNFWICSKSVEYVIGISIGIVLNL